jgi:hypothetical protein
MIRCLLAALLVAAPAAAQETRSLAAGAASPAASVDQLAWLTGTWAGGRDGVEATESYTAPHGGQITGHFYEVKDGKVTMMELMQIVPQGNSIAYQLRHFDPDMRGWEDATRKPTSFPLVGIEGDRFYFNGITLVRDGSEGMIFHVRIGERDGTSREISYRYRRVR